ncbi:hypothetical protein HPP92_012293 [Vanilla planifolia]|uniref:ATP-dependent Clp protease proteolytic subunit n=1 Tax=Vanilla planifolia TaxID=51239 RepID=A0A835V2L6_VANPL|nr:hypothetical protein HPP92_012293 [Vanilla planifolia]
MPWASSLSTNPATAAFPYSRLRVPSRSFFSAPSIVSERRAGKDTRFYYSSVKLNEHVHYCNASRDAAIVGAKAMNPPIMPAVMTPAGPLDLSSVLFRNRVIFVGKPIFNQVAQLVISQLLTLAAIDENADILIYLNCPGGSVYSVLAIYDCMSWGDMDDVKQQVNEAVQSRHKVDQMYVAFTGQPLEKVQHFTDRERYFSAAEAMDFGLIDGILETKY